MKHYSALDQQAPQRQPITDATHQLGKATTDWAISLTPYTPPATAEDEIARRAVAEIEREEGFDRCAQHRLHGSYDGDTEHRIAMKAIELFKQERKAGNRLAKGNGK